MKITFPGPAGPLEGLLEAPEDGAPRFAAIVCHPHPIHGGTMHNTVVFRVARGLRAAGGVTLRFNFRGVGESAGEHHGGTGPEGEEDDARAALDRLAREHPGLPLWGAGFSFGARVVASFARREPRLARLVLIAAPVDLFDCEAVARVAVPALAVWGDKDEFGTLRSFERRFPDASPLLETRSIEGADHLFRGRTPLLEEAVLDYARRSLEATP
jgi:alpha/beta superfamily hydrolase